MNVKIIDRTGNCIETLYRSYRVCYSKNAPTEIKIPEKVVAEIKDFEFVDMGTDYNKMIEFIKDKIDKTHESPLEHISFTFAIEGVSRALSHQLVRHRTFKFSQQSQRYCEGSNFKFITPNSIKFSDNPVVIDIYNKALEVCQNGYKALVSSGIPKEDARYLFPNATTTNLIVTADLRNFRHFYGERSCVHAQTEIRELAEEMMYQVRKYIPFADYKARKCSITCHECYKSKSAD